MRKVFWRIVLVIGAAAVIGAFVYALRPQPVMVDLAEASVGPMRLTVDEEGKTRIRERYVVSSPLMGRLRRITLDAGDVIRAEDTVLAVIEPTDPSLLDPRELAQAEARVRAAEAAVRQSSAYLDRAQAAYDFAESELGRRIEASERGATTPRELDQAKSAERTTREELRAAEHAKEIAEFDLEVARSALLFARGEDDVATIARMELRSPIDGQVLRVFQESVAVVSPGTPLLEVGDARDLEIVIDVLSTDAVRTTPGDRVIIEHWGGDESLEAVVRLVEPSGFMKVSALGIEEQRVNVIADFVTPAEQRASLGDAFRVEARIVVWERDDVLQVPTSAAFRDGERWAVFMVNDHRAQVRHIQIGRQSGRTTQVLSGLEPGDRVVLHPGDKLSDGVRVAERQRSTLTAE